ncbi:MAG: tetratricopeptide repeat protein [Gammaproteobacteria bacterium]|nr:tetratricopeptide repeat protein [Gammaproteobacteria bacterium]
MVNDSFNISDSSAFELVRYASVQISTDKIINPGQSCWLELCDDVAQVTNQQLLPAQIWTEFKTIFYQQWQFAIAADHYFSMTSSNLFSLMIDRQSNNTLMAIVVVELLKSLKLDLSIIDFPGALILKFEQQYIDPLTGKELSRATLESLARGHLGDHIRLEKEHLAEATTNNVKKRFLICLKQACLLEKKFETALLFNQLLLDILPNDPQQRMERGFLLQQLECYKTASDDFSYFIDNCPDDPNSTVLKMHLHSLQQQTDIYH